MTCYLGIMKFWAVLEMERVTLLVGLEGGDVQYDAIAVIKSCYWKILGV